MIIVEGVDGTGKTTLIEGLKRTIWPDYIFNFKYPEEKTPEENMAFTKGEYLASIRIFKELLARDKIIICDRFHCGEYSYGVIKRGYRDDASIEWLDEVEQMIKRELGANLKDVRLIVLGVVKPITAYRRLKKQGEYLTTLKEVSQVNARYQDIVKRTCLPVKFIFTDLEYDNHPEVLLDSVIEFIGGNGIQHL